MIKTTYQVACNGCGAGKRLYFKRANVNMRETRRREDDYFLVEVNSIRRELFITDLEKGCPKCGCRDLDILGLSAEPSNS